jgi:hypothetical protein
MRAVVVYESFFGCTAEVAEAVGRGIRVADPAADVRVCHVRQAPDVAAVDLLVVGGPTHALGLSTRATRWLHAQYWGDPVAPRRHRRPYGRPGDAASVRGWLLSLPPCRATVAAAFDTRMPGRLTGGAAPGIARRLRARGYRTPTGPEPFLVTRITGPLRPGEAGRAEAWGRLLAKRLGEAFTSPDGPAGR